MKIITSEKIDMAKLGLPSNKCQVCIIHVKILDINGRAKEIIDVISEKSWIKKLGAVNQIAYSARAEKTITKLVDDILAKVNNKVTKDFGEYLISDSAGSALVQQYGHTKIALAELWKEQKSGNPGFDFHTESQSQLIVYGEAKFNSSSSPYKVALDQIVRFVDEKKDEMELPDLQNLVSAEATNNAVNKRRGYIAAFSLNAKNYNAIFSKALETNAAKKLFCHSELYLIGIEL